MSDPVDRPAPTRHHEQETKLDADPGFRLPDLTGDPRPAACGIATADEPVTQRLDATYFDTERRDLLASRLTLRRRTGGGDAGWHLKLPAGTGARTEVRLPLTDGATVPHQLAQLLAGAARGRELRPVARIVTDRTVTVLRAADSTPLAEVADDAVMVILPDAPDAPARRWREIEVEATEQAPDPLGVVDAVTDVLVDAGARRSAAASKLGRALGFSVDDPLPATGHNGSPATAGGTLVAFLAAQRDLLISADIRLREPDVDGEAPHDARAAARRIRSALRVYRPLLRAGSGTGLATGLRRLGTAISAARAVDVLRVRLAALAGEGSPAREPAAPAGPAAGAAASVLDTGRATRRSGALAALRRALAGPGHFELLRALDEVIERPPLTVAAGIPAAEVMPALIATAWLHLRADAEQALADPGDAERVHAVRKDAKTVRYAAQAAAPQVPDLARFSGSVEQLQDVLGAHQDSVTALAAIADLTADPEVSAAERDVLQRWEQAERAAVHETLAQFEALWPALPVLPTAPVVSASGT
jgi:CHAD domain-containing protein